MANNKLAATGVVILGLLTATFGYWHGQSRGYLAADAYFHNAASKLRQNRVLPWNDHDVYFYMVSPSVDGTEGATAELAASESIARMPLADYIGKDVAGFRHQLAHASYVGIGRNCVVYSWKYPAPDEPLARFVIVCRASDGVIMECMTTGFVKYD